MVQVHHAAFSLASGYWTNKEILGDLKFRWSEAFADLVVALVRTWPPFTTTTSPILMACFAKRPRPSMGLVRFSTFGEK
jgi:hypothetical protein